MRTETTDRSDRFVIKSSKSDILTKQQLPDKLEAQTGICQNHSAPLKNEKPQMEKKQSKKLFISERNGLSRLSFVYEYISGIVDDCHNLLVG